MAQNITRFKCYRVLDSAGEEEWDHIYDEIGYHSASDIQQTNDGGYIIAGTRNGYGSVGLIKTDSTGEEEWNQAFGGDSYEYGRSVKQTNDGGYIVVGQSNSFGGADYDVYLIKTDSAGVE